MTNTQIFKNSFGLIRLLAAVQVLLVHAFNHFEIEHWSIDALKILPGVPIFFFVSGLMIYGFYERNRGKGWLPFYKNRFLRIYPGLWSCVLLSFAVVMAIGYLSEAQVSFTSILVWLAGQMSFVQFYNPDFMRGYGVGVLNGALWTIAVELQFYVLVPFLYTLLVRSKLSFVCLMAASIFVNLYVHHAIAPDSMYSKLIRVTFVPWVYIFCFGFLVGYVNDLGKRILSISPVLIIGLFIASMLIIGRYEDNASNSINPISTLLLSLFVFQLGHWEKMVSLKLNNFASKTDLSYGIYLYHMPVINFLLYVGMFSRGMNVLVASGVSVVCAVLSWFIVERPSLRLKV